MGNEAGAPVERVAASPQAEICWLSKVCATDSYRALLKNVMTCRYADATWSVATNGHMLMALRGEHVIGAEEAPANIAGLALDALRETEREDLPRVDAAALLRWADVQPPPVPSAETCKECGGTGEIDCDECNGEGAIECNMDYEHDCEDCDGQGHVPCDHVPARPEYRVGTIDGVPFNRDNFWPMAHVSGEARMRDGRAGSNRAPILLRGDGWLFVSMPMAANTKTDDAPAFASARASAPEASDAEPKESV